jgi:hypothetical protein
VLVLFLLIPCPFPNVHLRRPSSRRGSGVQSLCKYLELLVEKGGVVGGLVEGKVSALISAIDE